MYVAPNVEVTVTEKTTSVKKEKVTTVGDQEVRVVENSPTFTETLAPVTEVNEGDQVRSVAECVRLLALLFSPRQTRLPHRTPVQNKSDVDVTLSDSKLRTRPARGHKVDCG